MPTNRVIYQPEFLYVGPSPASGYHFAIVSGSTYTPTGTVVAIPGQTGVNLVSGVYRVQDISYGFTIPRTDINQFGELAPIDRIILDQPTVNLQFSYLLANFYNESVLGLTVSSGTEISAISGLITKQTNEKNYFIKTSIEGQDGIGDSSVNRPVYGIGNGFLSSYSVEGAVGSLPRVTIGVQALNMEIEASGSGIPIPAVNPENGTPIAGINTIMPIAMSSPVSLSGISALRPGDITLSLGGWNEGGADVNDFKLQSFNIGFDLSLDALTKLGSKYAFSREPRFPVPVTMSITANVGDTKSGSLYEMITNNNPYDLSVSLKHPTNSAITVCSYKVKRAFLDSQEFTSSIGANKAVTMRFTSQVGGSSQTNVGLFLSGYK